MGRGWTLSPYLSTLRSGEVRQVNTDVLPNGHRMNADSEPKRYRIDDSVGEVMTKLEKFVSDYTALPEHFKTENEWQVAFIDFKKALAEFWKLQGKIVDWI